MELFNFMFWHAAHLFKAWTYIPLYSQDVQPIEYLGAAECELDPIGQIGYGAKQQTYTAHCWQCETRCEGNHKTSVPDGLPHLIAWLWKGASAEDRTHHQGMKSNSGRDSVTDDEVMEAFHFLEAISEIEEDWATMIGRGHSKGVQWS